MLKTLRSKIIFLTCCIAFSISFSVGLLNYYRITQITLNTAIEGLAGETRLMAIRLQRGYDEVRNDTRIVSRTPPIKGLMRSLTHNGIDPKDGSTTELWRTRLTTIFSSVMQESPYYTQMRYIGLADNARELVRVNRISTGLEIVSLDQLQQKAKEPYVQAVIQGRKSFFFSRVTLNREQDKIDAAHLPTIRAIMPVEDEEKNVFGMIVINVDFEAMQKQMFGTVKTKKHAYLINQSGDYVEYDPKTDVAQLEFHETYMKRPPKFLERILKATTSEAVFTEEGRITYYVRMQIDKSTPTEFVGAVLRVPRDELLRDAYKTRRDTALLSILLILTSLAVTAIVTKWLTRPLKEMTHTISTRENITELDLPIESQDEVGELARAFDDVLGKLVRSNEELDNFAYITSHDLKEPLRAIHNHCNFLLKDHGDVLEDDGKRRLDRLMNLAKRMEKLINDLLYYSRLGREEYAIKETNINDVITDIKDTLHDMFEEKNVIISIPQKLPTIICDKPRVTELFRNLITNAIKYNDNDKKHIEISCNRNGVFSVKDNGIGIDKEYYSDVFRIFKRLHKRDKYGGGTGAGLTFVKKIIERHGGRIWLESTPEQGTTFYFTLQGEGQ